MVIAERPSMLSTSVPEAMPASAAGDPSRGAITTILRRSPGPSPRRASCRPTPLTVPRVLERRAP